jgi:hypothetical protein
MWMDGALMGAPFSSLPVPGLTKLANSSWNFFFLSSAQVGFFLGTFLFPHPPSAQVSLTYLHLDYCLCTLASSLPHLPTYLLTYPPIHLPSHQPTYLCTYALNLPITLPTRVLGHSSQVIAHTCRVESLIPVLIPGAGLYTLPTLIYTKLKASSRADYCVALLFWFVRFENKMTQLAYSPKRRNYKGRPQKSWTLQGNTPS